MIEIDGTEGGGQMLRTALSLSAVTGEGFHIRNIRGGREEGGLKAQHLTCVDAVKQICGADVSGAELGSKELVFSPYKVQGGDYVFNIGTAGSCSLVFECVALPLAFSKKPCIVKISGGTHVAWSPPYHFLEQCFSHFARNCGFTFSSSLIYWGFYPAGGGRMHARISPCTELKALNLVERGKLLFSPSGLSVYAGLPKEVGDRQKQAMLRELSSGGLNASIMVTDAESQSPGSFACIFADYAVGRLCFSALGEKGKSSEEVGKEAARNFLSFHSSSACLDSHLADQLMLPLSLAKGESSLAVNEFTDHMKTNAGVIEKFLKCRIEFFDGEEKRLMKIEGSSFLH